jgi:hypothetical protein
MLPRQAHRSKIDSASRFGLGVAYAQGYGVSQPQKIQRAAIA